MSPWQCIVDRFHASAVDSPKGLSPSPSVLSLADMQWDTLLDHLLCSNTASLPLVSQVPLLFFWWVWSFLSPSFTFSLFPATFLFFQAFPSSLVCFQLKKKSIPSFSYHHCAFSSMQFSHHSSFVCHWLLWFLALIFISSHPPLVSLNPLLPYTLPGCFPQSIRADRMGTLTTVTIMSAAQGRKMKRGKRKKERQF